MRLTKFSVCACVLALALSMSGVAQQVYVSGLESPSKVITIPNGNLLVTEVAARPNAGRVTFVGAGGATRVLIGGLPSGLAAPGPAPDGPNGLWLAGRTLYIANGEGNALRPGAQPRSTIPNPEGVTSPILSSILKVTFGRDLDQYRTPFTLKPEDHFALALGATVVLDDGAGNSAQAELVTNFTDAFPDPATIYRNSHPYGLAMHGAVPDTLFTADAGMNLVWQTNAVTGRTKALVQFPNIPGVGPGPPSREPVPDSVKPCGDQLLVTLLSGGPFAPGYGRVMLVNPITGEANPFLVNLNSAADVACAAQPVASIRALFGSPFPSIGPLFSGTAATTFFSFLVLELSTDLGVGAPGRLLRYDTSQPTVLLDGLNQPTSLALDESSGTAYVVSHTDGTILSAKYR